MLIDVNKSALLIIDVQTGLAPAVAGHDKIIEKIQNITFAAEIFNIPVIVTEHYPDKIGHCIADIRKSATNIVQKIHFSACEEHQFQRVLHDIGSDQYIIVGMETHVCVMQTALDLIDQGKSVYLVDDAVGSRKATSKALALNRLQSAGATIIDLEMLFFEWLRHGDHPAFRKLLELIKASG